MGVLEAIIFNGYKKVSRQAIMKHVLEDETILPSAEAGKNGAGSYKMMAASVHAYRNKELEMPKKKAKDSPKMKVAKKPKAVGSSSKRDVSKAKSKVEKVKSSGEKEKKSKSVK